jgi:hypothetical protein
MKQKVEKQTQNEFTNKFANLNRNYLTTKP